MNYTVPHQFNMLQIFGRFFFVIMTHIQIDKDTEDTDWIDETSELINIVTSKHKNIRWHCHVWNVFFLFKNSSQSVISI